MEINQIIRMEAIQHHFNRRSRLMMIVLFCFILQVVRGQEDRYSGLRPYELDWAGRYEDDHVPLIDFEKDEPWTVEATDGYATFGPSNEETILPNNVSNEFETKVFQSGKTFILQYSGDDGVLEYRYTPQKGDLSDITAQWMDGESNEIVPMDNGGIKLKLDDEVDSLITERFGNFRPNRKTADDPDSLKLIECRISGNTVISRWKATYQNRSTEVAYTFRIWQKSLVTDVKSLGGEVGLVSLGKISNAENPELLQWAYHWKRCL